ncbi:LOW QUALITY PROTEIN: hypothetical protein PHMEG_00010110 [Phytophthora megakarya]|uniref:Uncharacterized protein n=1 Tax=Phytophthora megakarya TaxID=4795 RepID=A0A225WF35_9STRA|nr:LOW QUALITY PROTEIN: hypothetical protein PHMEG_00010110 [Phytophthora megakarya]
MNAAAMLYERITQHFEAGDGINSDYLLQGLDTRKLQPNEAVTNCVDDIARKVTDEWSVYMPVCCSQTALGNPSTSRHGDWIKNNDHKSLTLAEALQRLRAAEHQRAQLRVQTRQMAL